MREILQLATDLGNELLKNKTMLVIAESCTGGGIAHAVTCAPGSSRWFDCGFVTYSNLSKTKMLNVPEHLIHQHGAVSIEVVSAMAKGALEKADGTIAIATTGIAGPDGATPGKPVGTVWFGLAFNSQVYAEKQCFSGDRDTVRKQSIRHALSLLLSFLRSRKHGKMP